ncbi:MAG: GerMN domain-containing protein [Treponema sp.]|jgi:hypothetical protein|nr:GerMN domain-containing protein [Treponema sp.]
MMGAATVFFGGKAKRRFFYLIFLSLTALAEIYISGLARRTFVFYTIDKGIITVENRMIKHSPSREANICRYINEALLGPVSPDLLPVMPRETRLKSLLYRNETVYADFTADAELPPVEGGNVPDNFHTLYAGILRNFSYVRDVRFFIEGRAAYPEGFGKEVMGDSGGICRDQKRKKIKEN